MMRKQAISQLPTPGRVRRSDIRVDLCQHFDFHSDSHHLPTLTLYDYSVAALMTEDLSIQKGESSATKHFQTADKVWKTVIQKFGKYIGDTSMHNLLPECLLVPSKYDPKVVAKHGHPSIFVFVIKSMKNPDALMSKRMMSEYRVTRAVHGEYLLFAKIYDNVIDQISKIIDQSADPEGFYYEQVIELPGIRDVAIGMMMTTTGRSHTSYNRAQKLVVSLEKKWKVFKELRKDGSKKARQVLHKGMRHVARRLTPSRSTSKTRSRANAAKPRGRSTRVSASTRRNRRPPRSRR